MFSPVKYKNLAHRGLSCNQVLILWHVSCTVNFSIVYDTLYNLDPRLSIGIFAYFTFCRIVLVELLFSCRGIPYGRGGRGSFWQVDRGDLEIVFVASGGVSAEDESVDGIVFICGAVEREERERERMVSILRRKVPYVPRREGRAEGKKSRKKERLTFPCPVAIGMSRTASPEHV